MSRPRAAAAALVYLAVGLLAYKGVLNAGFTADDWLFLGYAVPAKSVLVCFAPLVGHFIRPLVMLTYYGNYQLFGLWPLPYHVTLILVHAAGACLVALLAKRASGSARVAFWAGLIFTAFSGHSEAVGWVAGAADPWLIVFLLGGVLLFASALEVPRPGWRLAGACALLLLAYLAKESAAMGVALVVAWAVCAAWGSGRENWRRIGRRTAAVVAPLAGAFFVYLAIRSRVFGSPFGTYNQLNADRSLLWYEIVAFTLRTFFPATPLFVSPWIRALGIAAILASIAAVAARVRRQPQARAGLLFVCAGCGIALLPVIPLTISLVGTTSERFVYVPTAFSCILIAWTAVALAGRWRVVELALIAVILAAQYRPLSRAKVERLAAAGLFDTFMRETIALVRSDAPTASTRVLFLTLPDSMGGAEVLRSALYGALSVLAPDITDPPWRVVYMVGNHVNSPQDHISVAASEGQFRIALGPNRFIERNPPGETPDFKVTEWSPSGYTVQFKPVRWRRVLAYFSDGHIQKVQDVEGSTIDAVPFGVLDVPHTDVACTADRIRFSGWAVDDQGATRVEIERRDAAGSWVPMTTAERPVGTRPDIQSMFAGYPDVAHAEFNHYLSCYTRPPAGVLRLRVVVRDTAGHEAVLGERTVTWPAGL